MFNNFKKAFIVISFLAIGVSAQGQCAMCRASLESEEGKTKAEAVNDGIVYLMAFPYLLIGGLGYYIYKTRHQKKQ